jgi:hypothetical protein
MPVLGFVNMVVTKMKRARSYEVLTEKRYGDRRMISSMYYLSSNYNRSTTADTIAL